MSAPYAIRFLVIALAMAASVVRAQAGGHQAAEQFVAEAFGGEVPPVQRLWLTPERNETIREVLDRELGVLRVPYWGKGGRTAWVLDEIGKEQPITMGFVVEHGKLVRMHVLVFRESRGGEIQYPLFTDQFAGAGLTGRDELDRGINGISGATLSVNAARRLARIALLLAEFAMQENDSPR